MPSMDGFQATAEIRRREVETDSNRVPIIGLSGRAMEGDGDAAVARGMDGYLTKPLIVRQLRAALDYWVIRSGTLFEENAAAQVGL